MVAAMAVGATAAGAYSMANSSEEAPATVLAADQSMLGGGAITGSTDGMQVVTVTPASSSDSARRGDHQGRRVRAGARRTRGPSAAPDVRDAHQGRVDVGLRIPLGRAARRHRHRQFDRHPDRCGLRRRRRRSGPTGRLRQLGQAAPCRRHRDALRPPQRVDRSTSVSACGPATRSRRWATPEIRRAHTCTSRCCSTAPTASTPSVGWPNAVSPRAITLAEWPATTTRVLHA